MSHPDIGDAFLESCPGRAVLDHVSGRWGVLILSALQEQTLRFHELRDRVGGISEKVLWQNLRTLTRDGLLERTVHPSSPPQVSYALTELGQSLSTPLQDLVSWISDHTMEIVEAQHRHDESPPSVAGSEETSRRV